MKPKPLSERHIENTSSEWLALDGWRCIKTDLPHLRGLGVQEKGMADRLYIRYGYIASCEERETCEHVAEVLFIEWKRKGGNAKQHQLDWIAQERARGALVWLCGVDFPASIEEFQEFYRKSGLLRRGGL